MLNYLFIIQIVLLFTVLFLYWITDFIFLLIVGIVYLLVMAGLVFFLEVDILVCFLVIIDLGVFFILISFTAHLLKFLNKKYIWVDSLKNILFLFVIINLLIVVVVLSFNDNLRHNLTYNWFFLLNYVNYIVTNQFIWLSEMQLFKEIFFNFNSFAFILISILLFIDLLLIFFLYKLLLKITSIAITYFNFENFFFKKVNSTYFLKTQNFFTQYNVPAVSRVFKKKKYDSKTNNSTNNR